MPTTLTLTSVSPTVISDDGGAKLTLTGAFPVNVPLFVYLGASGTVNDSACYSGIAGQGNACLSLNGTTLVCYAAPLAADNVAYTLLVTAPSLGAQVTLAGAVSGRPPFFASQVWAIRSVLPPNYATGPRGLESEAPP